jgi:uncharacterized protein YbjQ (UPF0145 family)
VKKNIVGFLFCICLFFVTGCATIDTANVSSTKFRDSQYTPTDANKIKVFQNYFPEKEYIGLAVITLSAERDVRRKAKTEATSRAVGTEEKSERDMKKVKAEAAKLGADAIILVGKSNTTFAGVTEFKCVAIKFK